MGIQKYENTKANCTMFVLRQADTCSDTEHATDTDQHHHRGQKDNIMTEKNGDNNQMVVIMKSIPRFCANPSQILGTKFKFCIHQLVRIFEVPQIHIDPSARGGNI